MREDGVIANSDDPEATPRVLIVDDHHVLLEGLAAALRSCRYVVATTDADPPEEFVGLLESFQPDVVLLDLLARDDRRQWPGSDPRHHLGGRTSGGPDRV